MKVRAFTEPPPPDLASSPATVRPSPRKNEAQPQRKQTGLGSGNQQEKGRLGCKSWLPPSPVMRPVLGHLSRGSWEIW